MSASHGPTPEATTLIRSSPAAGAGRGTSSTTTTSGAPKRWIRAAFMFAPLIVQETEPSRSLGLLRVGSRRQARFTGGHLDREGTSWARYRRIGALARRARRVTNRI